MPCLHELITAENRLSRPQMTWPWTRFEGQGCAPVASPCACTRPYTESDGWLAGRRTSQTPASSSPAVHGDRLGAQSGPAPKFETRQTQSTHQYPWPGCDHSQKHESEMPSRMCKRRSPHEQATGLAAPLTRVAFHHAQLREANQPHHARRILPHRAPRQRAETVRRRYHRTRGCAERSLAFQRGRRGRV